MSSVKDYAFRNEEDYNMFVSLLVAFFEDVDYKLPKKPIELKKGTKTKLAPVFNEIHKEIFPQKKLKKDIEYFAVIKVLSHFQEYSDSEIYKQITR